MLLLPGLLLLTSCSATKQPTKTPEISYWTGDKAAIKNYLDSPYAQADRYLIEALK